MSAAVLLHVIAGQVAETFFLEIPGNFGPAKQYSSGDNKLTSFLSNDTKSI